MLPSVDLCNSCLWDGIAVQCSCSCGGCAVSLGHSIAKLCCVLPAVLRAPRCRHTVCLEHKLVQSLVAIGTAITVVGCVHNSCAVQRYRMLERCSAVDNDLMTPSFKLKRPQLQKHYQKQIDEMYKEAKKGM